MSGGGEFGDVEATVETNEETSRLLWQSVRVVRKNHLRLDGLSAEDGRTYKKRSSYAQVSSCGKIPGPNAGWTTKKVSFVFVFCGLSISRRRPTKENDGDATRARVELVTPRPRL